MNLFQAINTRVSTRQFACEPIDKLTQDTLQQLVEQFNKASGLNLEWISKGKPLFKKIKKLHGVFENVQHFAAIKGKRNLPDFEEIAGYFGEKFVLTCEALNLGTCWIGMINENPPRKIKIADGEELLCLVAVGSLKEQKTQEEKIVFRLMNRKTKALEDLYSADCIPPHWFVDGMQASQKAPSARHRQPAKYKFENGTATAYVDGTFPYDMIDLGISKAHFEIAADGVFARGNYAVFTKNQPPVETLEDASA